MSDIPRRRSSRNAKLASIPLGMAGRAAVGFGKKLVGGDREEIRAQLSEKAAEQLFTVLGELKGGAMKLGQALSIMEAAIPDKWAAPYRDALTRLQAQAPPMPAKQVHRMLDQQLGTMWRQRFTYFDDTAAASASIGQVHKAVWADGREVAVKVQYPGADEALKADLKTLGRIVGLIGNVIPGLDVKPIIGELYERTEEELDYRIEANNQRRFAKIFNGDPNFFVPRVIASSPKVVVTEWVDGTPLSQIIKTGTRHERNLAGELIALFHFSSPALVGLLHSDPHPGNFMLRNEEQLVVVDFGACAPLEGGLPKVLGQMVRLAAEERFDELIALLHDHNFVVPGKTISKQEIDDYLRPFTDPIKSERFHFSRTWLQTAVGTAASDLDTQFRTMRTLTLPPEFLMIFRVLTGSVGVCSQLDAEAPYMQIAQQWLPGLVE